jgi:hypothetical protein
MGAAAGAAAIGAGISATGSLASGMMGSSAAKSAASQQANAEREAAMLQQQQFESTRKDLEPFRQAGVDVLPDLTAYPKQAQSDLAAAAAEAKGAIPGPMTEEWLQKQPGYQWNLSQGMRALNASSSARGLGVSGANLKAASQWGTGLADSTYKSAWDMAQQRWSDINQNFTNQYNRFGQGFGQLKDIATLGETAAAKVGDIGQSTYANIGQNVAGAGQAQAAGTTASAQALSGGIQSLANAPLNYLSYQKLLGGDKGGYAGQQYMTSDGYTNTAPQPMNMDYTRTG